MLRPRTPLTPGDPTATYREILAKLVEHDEAYLERYPETPSFYASGVRYAPSYREQLAGIGTCLVLGMGDIADLCAWRAAELRRQGIAAEVVLVQIPRPSGGVTYTCRVRLPDGTEEDVQARLLAKTREELR